MPNGTRTTELVKAIERVLLEARTKITTGEIVDKVAERLPPGIPPVKRREDNPKAVIYDTVTKELAYMTGQDKRSGGENHFHFRIWIVRGYSGGYWVNLEIPGLDLHLMDDGVVKDHKPRPGSTNLSRGSNRPPDTTAREFLPQLIEAQFAKCAGCGSNERRFTHLEVDHIIPWFEGGPTELGNLQVLCTACHRRKGTRSQIELWQWMTANGGMWDPDAARFAHQSAVNLKPCLAG